MDRSELMQLAAEKAIREVSWDSIEFLFQPQNMLELLLRLDFDGMVLKIAEFMADDGPDMPPRRFMAEHVRRINRCVEVEKFYRVLCQLRARLEALNETS